MAPKLVKKGAKKRGRKTLSQDDKSVWDHVAKNVTPQSSNRFTGFEELSKSALAQAEIKTARIPTPKKAPRSVASFTGVGHLAKKDENQSFREELAPSSRQNVPGLDRSSAEKLRKGRLEIEGRVDLHGHTRKEAHSRLRSFLGSAHRQGKRCVLVITGKGSSERKTDDAPFMSGSSSGKGILREEVPNWLAQSDLRRLVLDYRPAQPKHGGDGALYVLLRRTR